MGHRDSTPEYSDEFHAWAENYINVTTKNHEKWGIPLEAIEIPRQFFAAMEEIMRQEDAVPVEPDPIDGYTIYWNKKKRLCELLCRFLHIPWQDGCGEGVFDTELLAQGMISEFNFVQWKAFLVGIAQKTGKRYGMPDEWAEKTKSRLDKIPELQTNGGDNPQQWFLLTLYQTT